jgi:hypothetical protein
MNDVTLPDFKKIADVELNYNNWSPEPLADRLARVIEDYYNKGKAKGKMETFEEVKRYYK